MTGDEDVLGVPSADLLERGRKAFKLRDQV